MVFCVLDCVVQLLVISKWNFDIPATQRELVASGNKNDPHRLEVTSGNYLQCDHLKMLFCTTFMP